MKQFAIAVLKRLLVSVALLIVIAGFFFLDTVLFHRYSGSGYAVLGLLYLWWANLAQLFVIVSVVWFLFQRIRRWREQDSKN